MINVESPNPKTSQSFLLKWVLANMVGLPVLLAPLSIGFFLIVALAILADGAPVEVIWYVFVYIILALSGAIIGGWLGLMQWLALRRQVLQAGKWISASSMGAAVGAPLCWLVYGIIFATIVERPDGIYYSFSYEYVASGLSLGLSIGVAQWLVMRSWVYKAEWWIIALPLCFTFGMLFANLNRVSNVFVMPIHRLTPRLARLFPDIKSAHVFVLFDILTALAALIGVSLVTGVLMRWLLQFQRKQRINEKADGNNVAH